MSTVVAHETRRRGGTKHDSAAREHGACVFKKGVELDEYESIHGDLLRT